MQLTDAKKKEYLTKILYSRLRILNEYGFYGLMLMHMKFGINAEADTAYTDGHTIFFAPKFLDGLKDSELDFVLMHEIMHVVLKHVFRGHEYEQVKFNIACDIVVNSNILYSHDMDLSSISIQDVPLMHQIHGKEGYLYTAEEVYEMLPKMTPKIPSNNPGKGNKTAWNGMPMDDHSHWDRYKDNHQEDDSYQDEWEERILSAMQSLQVKNSSGIITQIPLGIKRLVKELSESRVDWRKILEDFLSFEVNDYSFTPPDRRFDSSPFFLPDFNESEEVIEMNVLFNVDTSQSISDEDLALAMSEIKGAIEASNNRLHGYICFCDADVYDLIPFENWDDITKCVPRGGGGTDFEVLFRHLDEIEKEMGEAPNMIIILTDGEGKFPLEEARRNIPVCWIINNDRVIPPWGIVARMKH